VSGSVEGALLRASSRRSHVVVEGGTKGLLGVGHSVTMADARNLAPT
jgi:hypothetical protein